MPNFRLNSAKIRKFSDYRLLKILYREIFIQNSVYSEVFLSSQGKLFNLNESFNSLWLLGFIQFCAAFGVIVIGLTVSI